MTGEDAGFVEFDAAVEGGLTPEGEEDAVGSLFFDDFCDEEGGNGQEVDLIGKLFGGLDGGNIGVNEDGTDAFFAKGFEGLGAGVVEFSGLADFERSGTEDEYVFGCVVHGVSLSSCNLCVFGCWFGF